jgi:hypothetical protein
MDLQAATFGRIQEGLIVILLQIVVEAMGD